MSDHNFLNNLNIAVILPAYNEELTIELTIKSFNSQLPNASIWIIDNNSTDHTNKISLNSLTLLGCRGGVILENRKGKGNAIRRAFRDIDADIYIIADADFTYPANRVHDLIAPILNNSADIVVGDRHTGGHYLAENKRLLHVFGNSLVKKLVNNLFNSNLKDIMSCYRVFNRLFVKSYPILVEGFEIETDMTLHALDKRFRILEIPVKYRDRPSGSYSKLSTFKDGVRVITTIANILRYYRPLIFFGGTGLLFSIISFMVGFPVIVEWYSTGYIARIPSAILASGLGIISIILISIGLILDSIAHQNKSEFERELLFRQSLHL